MKTQHADFRPLVILGVIGVLALAVGTVISLASPSSLFPGRSRWFTDLPSAQRVQLPIHSDATNTTRTLFPIEDAYIHDGFPDTNFGDESRLVVSCTTDAYDQAWALVKFDLSSIPDEAIIQDASFRLWQYYASGANPIDLHVAYLNGEWSEQDVTWNHQRPYFLNWDTMAVGESNGWVSWDVTGLVRNWLGSSPNNGLGVRGPSSPCPLFVRRFQSRESGVYPRLVITYVMPTPTPVATPTSTPTTTSSPTPTQTRTPTPTSTPIPGHDLRVRPIVIAVQAVEGAGVNLVQGKGTAFKVNVVSTFPTTQWVDFNLELPDDQWFTFPTCSNGAAPVPPVGWRFPEVWGPVPVPPGQSEIILPYIPDGQRNNAWHPQSDPAGVVRCGCALGYCSPDSRLAPRPSGEVANVQVEIDPYNNIAETDETNNSSLNLQYTVTDTQWWQVLFVPYQTVANNCTPAGWILDAAARNQLEYLLGNFPIADREIRYNIAPWSLTWEDRRGEPGFQERGVFLTEVARQARMFGYNLGVGITCGGTGGAGGSDAAVFTGTFNGQVNTTLAHEFNHLVTGMGDIYSLDVAVGWDEAYCEYADGRREYACYIDTPKQGDVAYPYCIQESDEEVDCSESRVKQCVCSCDCSIYPADDDPRCDNAPRCDAVCCRGRLAATCAAGGGVLYSGPDGRIRHPAAEGFWVNSWLPITSDRNYFMDSAYPVGAGFPEYWNRVEPTTFHETGLVNNDGYRNLLSNPRFVTTSGLVSATTSVNRLATGDALLVSGVIGVDDSVTLHPFVRLSEATYDLEDIGMSGATGEYQIRLRDGKGQLLGLTSFDVRFWQPDPKGGLIDYAGFTYRIPWHATTKQIELVKNEQVLATRAVTSGVPEVSLEKPTGGGTLLRGQNISVRWSGHDPDKDALTYALALSADGGTTWTPVVIDITETTYDLTTTALNAGGYLVKVIGTDGVNTDEDVSAAAFQVREAVYLPLLAGGI